jgi:ubiquinone/menaquinone biosynthesis C-methylase UbiE
MAERQLENIEFINTTLFDERLKAESFDLVMAFFVLHFFDDIDVAFKRIYDLLKPGGLFISETACMGEQGVFMGKALRLAGALGLVPRMSMLTTQQLEQALENAGFRVVEKIRFSDRSEAEYTLFAKKS